MVALVSIQNSFLQIIWANTHIICYLQFNSAIYKLHTGVDPILKHLIDPAFQLWSQIGTVHQQSRFEFGTQQSILVVGPHCACFIYVVGPHCECIKIYVVCAHCGCSIYVVSARCD